MFSLSLSVSLARSWNRAPKSSFLRGTCCTRARARSLALTLCRPRRHLANTYTFDIQREMRGCACCWNYIQIENTHKSALQINIVRFKRVLLLRNACALMKICIVRLERWDFIDRRREANDARCRPPRERTSERDASERKRLTQNKNNSTRPLFMLFFAC
jgi:hypothetical protein